MKKPSTLAQQIRQAQRTFDGWTLDRRLGVRLEGTSAFLPPPASRPHSDTQQNTSERKK
jgi:hypothetical protein